MPDCYLLASFKKRNCAEKMEGGRVKRRILLEIDCFVFPGILIEIYKAVAGIWKAPLLYCSEQMICCSAANRLMFAHLLDSHLEINYIPWFLFPLGPITLQVCILEGGKGVCLCMSVFVYGGSLSSNWTGKRLWMQ